MVSVISAGLLLLVYGETQFHLVGADQEDRGWASPV